jgi:Tol biopolymer transport system component
VDGRAYVRAAGALKPRRGRLYFASDRPGGYGGLDLYVSRRDKRQDSGWGEPVNLGSEINTSAIEFGPAPFHDDDGRILYFSSGRPGGPGLADIYVIRLHGDESFGPAELVVELSSPANDFRPAIRRDGLEIFLDSDRPRSLGGLDIWFSTRARISDPWSLPQNLTVVNSPTSDARPAPSFDGTRLYFSSDRPGGSGNQDIYVSSMTALRPGDGDDDDGKHDDDDDDD